MQLRLPVQALAQKNHALFQIHWWNNGLRNIEETLIDISKENPILLHSYFHHKKVGCFSAGPLKLPSGALNDDDQMMSECVAVASVFGEGAVCYSRFPSKLADPVYTCQTPTNPSPHQTCPGRLPPLTITRDAVLASLLELDSASSMGPDELHPHLLKQCAIAVATRFISYSANPWRRVLCLLFGRPPK